MARMVAPGTGIDRVITQFRRLPPQGVDVRARIPTHPGRNRISVAIYHHGTVCFAGAAIAGTHSRAAMRYVGIIESPAGRGLL